MMAFDVIQRMNSLISADDHGTCGGDLRHAGEIVGGHRLLEKSQSAIADGADVTNALFGVPALIGIG